MSREALSEALRLVMGSASAVAALRGMEALGPLRAMLMPIPLPMEFLHSMEPAVALTSEDRQSLNTLHTVLELMLPHAVQGIPNVASAGKTAVRAAREVVPMLPELLPGMQITAEMFIRQLIRRMAIRLAEDLDPARGAGAAGSGTAAPSQYDGSGTSTVNGSSIHTSSYRSSGMGDKPPSSPLSINSPKISGSPY
jgi:aarF domain-containing kinase